MTQRKDPLLLALLAAIGSCASGEAYEDEACVIVPAETTQCTGAGSVDRDALYLPGQCGSDLEIVGARGTGTLKSITSQGGMVSQNCCYTVDVVDHDPNSDCIVGRPYEETHGARQAQPVAVSQIGSARDAGRAEAWALAGAAEHASVAAFARLGLQLMAHAAPTDLLRAVHEAAIDETRHADACFALATHFGGAQLKAGPFPFTEAVAVNTSLASLAAAATREGCISETLGAFAARIAAALAPDPEIRAALHTIAADEARHAALSYRIVAWALSCDKHGSREHSGAAHSGADRDVQSAVARAFAEPPPRVDTKELALRAGVDEQQLTRATTDAHARIIAPAMTALLAA